jgi:hypothetical protein
VVNHQLTPGEVFPSSNWKGCKWDSSTEYNFEYAEFSKTYDGEHSVGYIYEIQTEYLKSWEWDKELQFIHCNHTLSSGLTCQGMQA